jgi:hypothetical protein
MKIIVLLVFASVIFNQTDAQTLSPTVISSSGAFYSNANAMLSITIGEMAMVQTFFSAGNILTQGFQQPEDFSTYINEINAKPNSIMLYPNPASEFFTLQTNFNEGGTYVYSVVNAIGQIVIRPASVKTQGGSMNLNINLKEVSPGMYFVKVIFTSATQQKKSFQQKLTVIK